MPRSWGLGDRRNPDLPTEFARIVVTGDQGPLRRARSARQQITASGCAEWSGGFSQAHCKAGPDSFSHRGAGGWRGWHGNGMVHPERSIRRTRRLINDRDVRFIPGLAHLPLAHGAQAQCRDDGRSGPGVAGPGLSRGFPAGPRCPVGFRRLPHAKRPGRADRTGDG
jgi:hypothetical protein